MVREMLGESRVVCDPSQLQLKKELTQIRKSAKASLRDPGTTWTWKSPTLSSARSAIPVCVFEQNDGIGNRINKNDASDKYLNNRNGESPDLMKRNGCSSSNNEKRVFLYNWWSNGNNRSLSEKSLGRIDCEIDDRSSIGSGNSHGNVSNGRNEDGDSKSDGYVGDRRRGPHCYPGVFKCRDTRLKSSLGLPVGTRSSLGKKKCMKVSVCNLKKKKRKNRKLKGVFVGKSSLDYELGLKDASSSSLGFGQEDSLGLMEQSDGTEEVCDSEDLQEASAESPLLYRLKHRKSYGSSAKFLREDSFCSWSTPALSTNSYKRYFHRQNPSVIGSWDGAMASSLEMEDEVDDLLELPGRQGCGLPCYWGKRSMKHKGACRSCCSPSLSTTLRRQGSKRLSGKASGNHHSSYSEKQMVVYTTAQGCFPLLDDPHDRKGSSLGTRNSDDESLTNLSELKLEGLSSLDGRRWSSICESRERFKDVAVGREDEGDSLSDKNRSLSQRYRPMFFDELVGQHVVVQSLMNSITMGRVAPMYLFQGPRGTGKTSTAKVFAAALNCLANEGSKPCGICKECTDYISGKSKNIIEVDGTSKKEIEQVRYLLKNISASKPSAFTGYKAFIIHECHLLPSKAWLAFLKFLDEPVPRVVFILITTNLESVPRTVLSRCQKYIFNKIKDGDILSRLQKISTEENLDVEPDALELMAQNADGSLRDAETMLDQLTLLGKRITTSLVNELVGLVSDEKLLELLESALASNTAETVKRARELLDTGLDPLALMSQLASLIMDIIAGASPLSDTRSNNTGKSLNGAEMEKLKHALKLLSEAEKQLRISSERSTWFTATLLQLGSVTSPDFTMSGSSRRLSSRTSEEAPSTASRDAKHLEKYDSQQVLGTDIASLPKIDQRNASFSHLDMLDELWLMCIEQCHSRTLRQLLRTHGKLLSLSKVDGVLVACIAFGNEDIKSRAEGFIISITNSFETILRRNVVVRIVSFPNGTNPVSADPIGSARSVGQKQMQPTASFYNEEGAGSGNTLDSYSDSHRHKRSDHGLNGTEEEQRGSQMVNRSSLKEERKGSPMQRIQSLISQERLETAWLQTAEKGSPRSGNRARPEKNQVLPQDDIYGRKQLGSVSPIGAYHQEDALNNEIKILKVDKKALETGLAGKRMDAHHISPSLLHQKGFSGNLDKEYQGYASGSGAGLYNMWFCWNTKHRKSVKVNQGSPIRLQKGRRFLCFGDCRKKSRQKGKLRHT